MQHFLVISIAVQNAVALPLSKFMIFIVGSDLNSLSACTSAVVIFFRGNLKFFRIWAISLIAKATLSRFFTFWRPFSTEATNSECGIASGVTAKFKPFSKSKYFLIAMKQYNKSMSIN